MKFDSIRSADMWEAKTDEQRDCDHFLTRGVRPNGAPKNERMELCLVCGAWSHPFIVGVDVATPLDKDEE